MVKIIDMVTKSRTNTEKRATDKNNQSPDPITVTNKVEPTQIELIITANLSHTPASNYTSRFDSWAHLCLGTDRRYPNTDDLIHSAA